MDIRSLHQQGVSVSEIARREGIDRKTVRKYLRETPREYRRKPKRWKIDPYRVYLRERWEQGVENATRLFRETAEEGLYRLRHAGQECNSTVAGRRTGTCFRTLRDCAGRASADGLGTFRQLGRSPALRFCPDVVLVADEVCRVHAPAGYRDTAQLHDPRLPLLWRSDGSSSDRQHEDVGCRSHRGAAAVPPEDAGFCQLLWVRAAGVPPVSAGDQGQDRVHDSLHKSRASGLAYTSTVCMT